jgi:TonB-dependent SusC/RagA subfamily outer membrane receptor
MEYLLKASGLVILLILFYYLFLKNETFFKSIRSYFLIGLIIVICLPLIEIPVYVENITNQFNTIEFIEATQVQTETLNSFDWIAVLSSIYILGLLLFSLKFIFQLASLSYLITKHKFYKEGKYYFIETSKDISPFSFFNIIIFNNQHFSSEELEQIINHEKAHAMQWHSLDTLLAHILVILLWFNPFVWLYKKAVQQNLEFLADSYALELANNQKLYQLTMLKTSQAAFCTDISNNFYNSLIKKRIVMLHKNRSTSKNQWKYALLIPMLIAFIFTFNTKTIAQEKEIVEIKEQEKRKIELVITKDSEEDSLNKLKKAANKLNNLDINFKGIKRNSKGEITAIKITAKSKGSNANYSVTGNNPIKPIKISYNSEDDNIGIGAGEILHKKHYVYEVYENGNVDIKTDKKTSANYVFVTSDSDKSKSKGGNEIVEVEEITITKKGENSWIQKDGETQVNVEVTKSKDGKKLVKIIEKEGDHEVIEIIEDGDENVFHIKKDGDKLKKHKISKTDNFVFISDGDGKEPLIFIDGKEASKEEMEKLEPDFIKSVTVLKDDSAIKKYGKKGKNGVILITTKK